MESMDRFCWSCGSGIYKNDRFCRKCGSDLGLRQPIEQGHETQPEDSTLPGIDTAKANPAPEPSFNRPKDAPPPPEVVVKEVSTTPASPPPIVLLWEMLTGSTEFSSPTTPSPRPEPEEVKTPPDSVTISLRVIGALGWLLAVPFFFMAVFISLPNAIRTGGEYWATMDVLGSLLIGGIGVAAGMFCRRKLRRREGHKDQSSSIIHDFKQIVKKFFNDPS